MNPINPSILNTIIPGDCIDNLRLLPDSSIDLIFADPPYNLQLNNELYRPNQTKVVAVTDDWDKFDSMASYDHFCQQWLSECYRILKPSGSIWVIGTYHNIFRVGAMMQNLGFWLLNDIVWIKTNPMPNFKGTRFNNAHETLIWATKSKEAKYTFHYHALKTMNDDLQMRSDWWIPICSGGERIKVNGEKAHSTQKPVELLYRIILATSNVGDLIVDPFFGSGTTGAVAKRLGRHFIGFERESFYVQVATDRIASIVPLTEEILSYRIEQRQPKVLFASLLAKGFISVGETLYSKDKRFCAVVQANASLVWNESVGSIHKISAAMLQKESNNGWSFWYALRDGALVSIDDFRYDYEKQFLQNKN